MLSMEIKGIYLGPRDKNFKEFIKGLLEKGGFSEKAQKVLLDKESMDLFSAAFTSDLVDPNHNYQIMEQFGDKVFQLFMPDYLSQRFPQLECCEGVKVKSRLLINYGSKHSFFKIAEKLGFWEYVTATNNARQRSMKDLLEDTFEAFIGTVTRILDKRIKHGVGYAMVYDFLAKLFDEMNISLAYEDLYDTKTRLKELFDTYKDLGVIEYVDDRNEETSITHSAVYRLPNVQLQKRFHSAKDPVMFMRANKESFVKLGEGSAAKKPDAQQKSSAQALECLNKQGYVKEAPEIYNRFAHGKKKEVHKWTSEELKKQLKDKTINDLVATRPKNNKKQSYKYESTMIAGFCRDRNRYGVEACVELKADVNIPDTDGMKPLDLLFIGNIKPNRVKKMVRLLMKAGCDMELEKQIFDNYFVKYTNPEREGHKYFSNLVPSLKLVDR